MPFAILLPELVAVATPPPVVCDANPLAVPELVVVAFWFVPVAERAAEMARHKIHVGYCA